jgi:hypothetical protein
MSDEPKIFFLPGFTLKLGEFWYKAPRIFQWFLRVFIVDFFDAPDRYGGSQVNIKNPPQSVLVVGLDSFYSFYE